MHDAPDARAGHVAAFATWATLFPEALLLVSGDAVLAANPAAGRLLQRPDDELVRWPALRWLPDAKAWQRMSKEAARSRALLPFALTVVRPDGTTVACRCHAGAVLPRADHRPALLLLRLEPREAADNRFMLLNQRIDQLSREIARRREAESSLHAYAERLRVTLASIGDAVIATDDRGDVTLMNPVAERLTGWAGSDAAGRPLEEVFVIRNATLPDPPESPVRRVLRDGVVTGLANHTVLVGRDGRERPIDDSGAPIRDDTGRLIGVVLVFRDVSERYAMEQAMQQQTQTLLEADRRKDEFLSMLAHELRNPLAPLHTGLRVVGRLDHREETARILRMMDRQLQHLTRIVDDLLDVARLTRGRIELRLGNVSIQQALREALEMSASAAEQRGIQVEAELGPPEIVVMADATRLVQVFSNLIGNAIKFSRPGGRLWLAASLDGTRAEVRVRDEGIGIDARLLPKVFDLFMQGDTSLDRAQGGLGIGLTVVKAIVGLHDGSVHAHSDGPGRGTEFVVRLPRVRSPPACAPAADSPSS